MDPFPAYPVVIDGRQLGIPERWSRISMTSGCFRVEVGKRREFPDHIDVHLSEETIFLI
jgi:hypothetical protein